MTSHPSPEALSDFELLERVKQLAANERQVTAHLVAHLAELDARRLYLGHGYSSLFTYCTQALHLSEHAAYGRIEAARLVRRFPKVLGLLESGSLSLTTASLLSPVLTKENHEEGLARARHKTKREVEVLVASLRPEPDVPAIVRKLPTCATPVAAATEPVSASAAPSDQANRHSDQAIPRSVVRPLTPDRYRIQLTVSRETHEKLRRVQDLARHRFPKGDLSEIFDKALSLLLDELERSRCGSVTRPRARSSTDPRSRHVPAAVRRAVWTRDGARCAFVGPDGRCTERGFLEIHHVVPFADGGETVEENLELRCRAHNAYEAQQYFGSLLVREASGPYDMDGTATDWHGLRAIVELGPGPTWEISWKQR